jgi:hypothetical protein
VKELGERQEDHEFEASLDYIGHFRPVWTMRPCLKKKIEKEKDRQTDRHPPASTSSIAGTTDMNNHTWLI